MKEYGLIGYPLSHSFSKKYFTEKFANEGIEGHHYDLYEMEGVDGLKKLVKDKGLLGLNVTIPHKKAVIPLLKSLNDKAERIGAVNVIKVDDKGELHGYNSDYFGFKKSLEQMIGDATVENALILGTGGASFAVRVALEDMGIQYKYVTRKISSAPDFLQDVCITYEDITPNLIRETKLIVNTTPLGMSPNTDQAPDLPYQSIGDGHYLYDLVYNPLETKFMKEGKVRGAKIENGLDMLHLQAEESWRIWNQTEES